MSERTPDIFGALKSVQWERAKGELRAMVALLGSQPAQYEPGTGKPIQGKFHDLGKRVEAFIKDVEDDGLHE